MIKNVQIRRNPNQVKLDHEWLSLTKIERNNLNHIQFKSDKKENQKRANLTKIEQKVQKQLNQTTNDQIWPKLTENNLI